MFWNLPEGVLYLPSPIPPTSPPLCASMFTSHVRLILGKYLSFLFTIFLVCLSFKGNLYCPIHFVQSLKLLIFYLKWELFFCFKNKCHKLLPALAVDTKKVKRWKSQKIKIKTFFWKKCQKKVFTLIPWTPAVCQRKNRLGYNKNT